jgi:hypothetical protein
VGAFVDPWGLRLHHRKDHHRTVKLSRQAGGVLQRFRFARRLLCAGGRKLTGVRSRGILRAVPRRVEDKAGDLQASFKYM